MAGAPSVAQRRADVRRLAQGGASNRAIAAQLNISKDTVRRDLEASEPPAETLAQRLAQRAARTETAMRQLSAAVQAVGGAHPAHTPTTEETARRWYAELCATANKLLALADQFTEYYPGATACASEDVSAP
ncbi:hypothetical protein ABZ070_02305 [Streptomyces sp. NPDC006283]|uniref:hypothetical protein n=1 Tax=Streptomyces sp. NPDC006283 TaxID=3156741 RepID=UPI0033B242EF